MFDAATVKVASSRKYFCPLAKREIADAYCYEINSVAFGLCKPNLIDNSVSRETAEKFCESCENRAM